MTNQTLRARLPDLRAETMQTFERRLRHHAQEAADLAQIALQLDLAPVAVDLVETKARVNATRLAILGVRAMRSSELRHIEAARRAERLPVRSVVRRDPKPSKGWNLRTLRREVEEEFRSSGARPLREEDGGS